jgi:hypothetical protein
MMTQRVREREGRFRGPHITSFYKATYIYQFSGSGFGVWRGQANVYADYGDGWVKLTVASVEDPWTDTFIDARGSTADPQRVKVVDENGDEHIYPGGS